MKYNGFYINLERSPERRQKIEEELARNGLGGLYTRFQATNGNALAFPNVRLKESEIGAFISHWLVLKENSQSKQPLHIIEDDILLSPQMMSVLDWTIESGQLQKYDILYTDVSVPLLNDACLAYKEFYDTTVKRNVSGQIEKVTFTTVDMRELIFASNCSFLVNPHSIVKIATLYEQELKAGALLPVDLHVRKLCQDGVLKVGCIFPFITSIRPESCFATTMEKRFDELPALAANMLRHSFFIGCDWDQCLRDAAHYLKPSDPRDKHRQLMLFLLNYSLTPGYKKC